MIEITNRDKYLLEILNENGLMTYKQAGQLYETSGYHFKRLKQLENDRYIKKFRKKYLILGSAGMNKLNLNKRASYNYQKRFLKKHEIEKREVLVDLMLLCNKYNYEWFYSRTAKSRHNINKGISINGLISCQGKNYPVYVLSEYPSEKKIKHIQKGIPWLKTFDGAFIICLNQEIYCDALKISINNNRAPAHLYLLEYPADIDLALSILSPGIMDSIYKTVLKINEILPASKAYADKMAVRNNKEYYITNLLVNDLIRLNYIKEYLNKWYELEQRPIIVIRKENQDYNFSGVSSEGIRDVVVSDVQLKKLCSV